MKRIIGIGLLCVWTGIGEITAQEPVTAPETETTDASASTSATATNEAPPNQTVPDDIRTNIIARFPFDVNECSDHTSGLAIPVMFKRDSTAYVEGQQVEINAPRLVAGKFGKGILLEESHANLLSRNQAGIEGDTSGEFIPLKNATLSLTTNEQWQGQQSLKVETSGEAGEEGVALEGQVEKAQYNGKAIVPAYYVASVYLKGEGNLMLFLKTPDETISNEPVYVDLGMNEWTRFFCTYAATFPAKNIGPKHEADWQSLLPADIHSPVKIQFQCVTIDKQEMTFYADGFQVEQRLLPFAGQGPELSPHSWTPGKTTTAQDEFSFSTKGDLFTSWKQSGTISFWFKPYWGARDGTKELMLYMGPNALYLRHANAKIRFLPAGVTFTPYDWKDNWHHIAVTWTEEGKRVLYVDGYDYVNAHGELKPLPPTTDFMTLSYSGNGTSPNGIMDELLLFNSVLNTDQIKEIASYDPLNPPKPKPPEETPSTTNEPTVTPAETTNPEEAPAEVKATSVSTSIPSPPVEASSSTSTGATK